MKDKQLDSVYITHPFVTFGGGVCVTKDNDGERQAT